MFNHGYSLFELVLVLALITVLAGLSFYFIGIADSAMIRTDIDRLFAVMVFMQRKAFLEGKPTFITFDLKKNQYCADHTYTLSPGVMFGAPDTVFGPPSHPQASIKDPITWPGKVITFYPYTIGDPVGAISTGAITAGAVYLTNKRKSVAYALTCDASQVPHIRRYRYEGKWVLLKG